MGFAPSRPRYATWLALGAAGCLLAAVVGELRFGSSLYLYDDVKGKPGAFQGAMTVVSGLLLTASALFCGLVGESLGRQQRRGRRAFLGFGGLLLFLAVDELLMVHEWAAQKLERLAVHAPFGMDADVYVFALYAAIAGVCGVRMLPTILRHRSAWPLLATMFGCAFASEAVDFVPWDSMSEATQRWAGPIEEGLKTLATLSAALFGHALLADVQRQPPRQA